MSRLLVHEGHQYAEDRLPDGVDGATLPTAEEWFAAAKAGPVEPVEAPETEAQPAEVKARRSK